MQGGERDAVIDGAAPDVVALNDLITAATHETASAIGFALEDICSAATSSSSDEESASQRVRELHVAHNAMPSTVVKDLRRIDTRGDVKRAAREDFAGDAIVIRTVLPSVRVPGIGGQVTIVERGDGPGRYLYVGP